MVVAVMTMLEKATTAARRTWQNTDDGVTGTLGRATDAHIVMHPQLAAVRYMRDYVRDPMASAIGYAIAAHVDETGRAAIGVRALASSTGWNPTTVVRAVSKLESAGHIMVERGGRGSVYRFRGVCDQVARPRDDVARSTACDEVAQPRDEVARPYDQIARPRDDVARSVPAAAAPSTRTIEKSSSSAVLQPHAVEALGLLRSFIDAEVERVKPGRPGAYRASVRRRVERDLAELQDKFSVVEDLVYFIETGTVKPAAATVIERLEAVYALPANDAPAPTMEELLEIAPAAARAAYERGLAEVRGEAS